MYIGNEKAVDFTHLVLCFLFPYYESEKFGNYFWKSFEMLPENIFPFRCSYIKKIEDFLFQCKNAHKNFLARYLRDFFHYL